jgi:hypothetical protein
MICRLREMTPADVPAVLERLREQNERDGTSYGMPQVFDERGLRLARIPLALVAVNVETGEVVQGHVWEQTVEQLTFGTSPFATAGSIVDQEAVWFLLRERGFRDLHILVPLASAPKMEQKLDEQLGLLDTGKSMKHFYRLLDPVENAELRNWYKQQEERDEPSPAGSDIRHNDSH